MESLVARYLLHRLNELGVNHLFGVCGDFSLSFINQVYKSPVQMVNCCNELNAGYAADAYARLNGLAAVNTTFTVGELSAINAIAGAYAEHVPVVMIGSSPERRHETAGRMLHHTLGDYKVVREMFRLITVACEYLIDPAKVPQQIDHALQRCLYYKKPIYFQLPSDMVIQKCEAPQPFQTLHKESDKTVLSEAVNKTLAILKSAKNPVILLGFEIDRHHLQPEVLALIEKSGFPFATFTTAKSTLNENHPQFIGCYKGNWSRDYVKETIEKSDCVLMLGGFFIDSDTGGFTAQLDESKLVKANFEKIAIKNHEYQNLLLSDFIKELTNQIPASKFDAHYIPASKAVKKEPIQVKSNTKLTNKHFFNRIAHFIRPNDIVIADVGDCLYSTASMIMPDKTTFIAESFYNSIGYSVGAALGAAFTKNRRTILLVGDGSFQVTAQEISTMLRYKLKPIIFLLNNDGYAIERAIHDGDYCDLQMWRYHQIPYTFGGDPGIVVKTEEELDKALKKAENTDALIFIEVQIDRYDFGDVLRMAGAAMAESAKNSYD